MPDFSSRRNCPNVFYEDMDREKIYSAAASQFGAISFNSEVDSIKDQPFWRYQLLQGLLYSHKPNSSGQER